MSAMRRQVTTREELDALPETTVVRDADECVCQLIFVVPEHEGTWLVVGDEMPYRPSAIALPAIVLWRPDEDEADGDEREALALAVITAYGEDEVEDCPCDQDYRVADAVLAAGFRRQGAVTVSRARVEALCRLLVDGGDMTPLASRWLLRLWGAS